MKRMAALLAGAALILITSSAMATVVNTAGGDGPNSDMQSILNSITQGGVSNVNAFTGFIQDPNDSLWQITASGQSAATMIIELAGRANTDTFGIYDASNINTRAILFDGAAAAGHKVSITFDENNVLTVADSTNSTFTHYAFASSTFGFFMGTLDPTATFFSDTTKNTADNFDHMVAYAGKGDNVHVPGNPAGFRPWTPSEYVLGFENTLGGGDHDYNDMVLMIESVAPVPEPGTMMLLGAGFLGLAIYGKRRKNA